LNFNTAIPGSKKSIANIIPDSKYPHLNVVAVPRANVKILLPSKIALFLEYECYGLIVFFSNIPH
jgi:hypothetical protein